MPQLHIIYFLYIYILLRIYRYCLLQVCNFPHYLFYNQFLNNKFVEIYYRLNEIALFIFNCLLLIDKDLIKIINPFFILFFFIKGELILIEID